MKHMSIKKIEVYADDEQPLDELLVEVCRLLSDIHFYLGKDHVLRLKYKGIWFRMKCDPSKSISWHVKYYSDWYFNVSKRHALQDQKGGDYNTRKKKGLVEPRNTHPNKISGRLRCM